MSNSSVEDSGNRFSAVDDNHHGGLLWITASLSLTYFVFSCISRIILFYGQFTKDTICLIIATVFGFIQVMIVYSQLAEGYGTSIDLLSSRNILAIQKEQYAADVLFIIALALSKLSTVWFVARLTPTATHSKLCTATAALCIAWGFGSVLSLSLKCDLAEPWITIGRKCSNLLLRWQLISAFDVVTELVILTLITGIIFNLQMSSRKKFIVVLGFLFRLPLTVLAIVHVHYLQSYITSTNATFDQIIPSVIASAQMGWGLISATIPCLKSFVANMGSGYLGATLNANLGEYSLSGGRSGDRSGNGSSGNRALGEESYVLKNISGSRPRETGIMGGQEERRGQRDTASIRSTSRVSNDGSQEFIIRKTGEYPIGYKAGESPQQNIGSAL